MRKLRRPLGLAVAALAVAASLAPSLAACGSGASSDGTTTLHVVGWKGGGAEPANVAQINAAFQKSHPKIKLDFSYVPPNDVYQQKIQSQLLAGNAADVVMVDPQKVQIWGKSGYFADLGQRSWAASISPAVKSFVSYQDKVLASPMELSPVGVYVNLDILAKAGVTAPPTDFPAFLAALGKLKAAGQPGYSFPDAQGYMAEFVMLMSAATTVYQDNPNWDQQFLQGKVTFPQSFREPLQQIQQLGTNGYVDFKNAVGTDEATTGQPDFLAGKSAFFAGGSWSAAARSRRRRSSWRSSRGQAAKWASSRAHCCSLARCGRSTRAARNRTRPSSTSTSGRARRTSRRTCPRRSPSARSEPAPPGPIRCWPPWPTRTPPSGSRSFRRTPGTWPRRRPRSGRSCRTSCSARPT
ncbi:ABC transporter substrate-binding protein [Fodinicola feengrottensis]|uniref:ABC transporter substrate-binding protein n=1 Tax=Fodinicola feengrottensis TaxID=435914 RepID=UPI0013D0FECF|nr:ABC transporter substrate-binding protein [Fodinicola feengrottensis]